MIKSFYSLSPWRQTGVVGAIAVLLTFVITVPLYLLILGWDDHFWDIMTLALLVPWGVALPLSLHLSRQREKLANTAARLEEAQEELKEVNRRLRLRANFDGLTGLANREYFIRQFEERRQEFDQNILMIVDADHFKNINDGYGHPVGDRALILLSGVFTRLLRQKDLVGRIGGEEFGILLTDTSVAEGEAIAEMVRHEVENILFEPQFGLCHRLTVSIGVTAVTQNEDRATPMRNADLALFEAKRRGRNQCVLYAQGMSAKPRPLYESVTPSDLSLAAVALRA